MTHEQRAYIGLRDLMLAGEIVAGERLNEVKVAERLGMSRTPVRWALIELEHGGLVEALPAGGFAARSFTPREVESAMVLRGCLEGLAARLCAERGLATRDRAALRLLLDEGARVVASDALGAEHQRAYAEINERFHGTIARASGNDALVRAIENNNRLPFASPSAMLPVHERTPDGLFWLRTAHVQHEALVDAMETRQGMRAQSIAEEHARIGRRGLERALARPEQLNSLWPGLAKARGQASSETIQGTS